MEDELKYPNQYCFSLKLPDDSHLYLYVLEFQNAIQASIYQDIPKMGSSVLAYHINGFDQTISLFTGNHEYLASSVAQILCKYRKLVYSSVYLPGGSVVSIEHIKSLLDQYKPIGDQNDIF